MHDPLFKSRGIVAVALSIGIYTAIFPLLYPWIADSIGAFSIVPVLLAAGLLGTWEGVTVAFIMTFSVTLPLYHFFGRSQPSETLLLSATFCSFVLAFMALIVGRMRELNGRLEVEIKLRSEAEAARASAERKLCRLRVEFEQRVFHRTRELQQASHRLEQELDEHRRHIAELHGIGRDAE